tara:strand:+ start:599 stop:1525 length:927 start_codon:yes stop_codon:yes gene_type:complete
MIKHTPVMLDQSIKCLDIQRDGCYIDATFGSGGHSLEILSKIGEKGLLFSLDKDHDVFVSLHKKFQSDKRFKLEHGCFSDLEKYTKNWGVYGSVNGILFDLGVSSHHLDTADRGFSFQNDGKVDMRFNYNSGISAHELINKADEEELANIIWKYGEERYSRKIAHGIVSARKVSSINSTSQLSNIVNKCIPKSDIKKNNATRTFQAIRIFVNKELDVLKKALDSSYDILAPSGRLVLITYHSLEDRVIKNFLIHTDKNLSTPKKLPVEGQFLSKMFKFINKSIKPSAHEIAANRRSRSAKLSVLERIQ